jgi:MFS family permease
MVGAPGLMISGLLLLANEPPRRGVTAHGQRLPVMAVLREIRSRKAIYLPLFIGLALSAAQSTGMQAWRAPFMIRTYGWNEAQIGRWMGLMFLLSSLLGATLGTLFVEWLAKRYKDANVRASTILFAIAAPFEIIAPLARLRREPDVRRIRPVTMQAEAHADRYVDGCSSFHLSVCAQRCRKSHWPP